MARLPRLAVPGCAHLVLLRGHNGETVFRDDDDRALFLDALQAAFKSDRLPLHAYALRTDCVWLLCTPAAEGDLSRAMQALGRRFAAAFNRKYDRSGSLWDGRFRSTVVEPGAARLTAMVFVDLVQEGAAQADPPDRSSMLWSSAAQHLGYAGPVALGDLAEYWTLGNTPFDRAAAYRTLLADTERAAEFDRIASATRQGWALGSREFIEELEGLMKRTLRPRKRGRPRKTLDRSE
jgi:putative transposase